MDDRAVLRCALCNKPFDKEATLKRHGYYCRSRNGNGRGVRSRSCIACAKAKSRCDNGSPSCSRCLAKGIECHTQATPPRHSTIRNISRTSANQDKAANQNLIRWIAPEATQLSTITESEPDATENPAIDVNFNFTDLVNVPSDWNLLDDPISDFDILGDMSFNTNLPTPSASSPMTDEETRLIMRQQNGHLVFTQPPSIPTMPNCLVRSFAHKPTMRGGTRTAAILMARVLTSYPAMMRNATSPPPFIHPSSLSGVEGPDSKSLESLTTCVNLMQMDAAKAAGSRKLVWKNVRLECERIQQEVPTLDQWGLLSSLQALLIYMLLRLQEGETTDNNFDLLLITTCWYVASNLNQSICNTLCLPSSDPLHIGSQRDWIFQESRYRLSVTFRCINMLFTLEPSTNFHIVDDFLLAPLPARKQLWEAPSEKAWAQEKSRDVAGAGVFGLMKDGEMVRLDERQAFLCGDRVRVSKGGTDEGGEAWAEWCSGMDGLGTLVMLAASLPMGSVGETPVFGKRF